MNRVEKEKNNIRRTEDQMDEQDLQNNLFAKLI